jgi:hypothetical protein
MTSPRRSQFHRSLAAGVAAAALAAPAAQAVPSLEPGSGYAGQVGTTAGELRTDAAQAGGAKAPALAQSALRTDAAQSGGATAPALAQSALRTDAAQAGGAQAPAVAPEPITIEAPAVTTIVDDGFNWGSAAIGAGAAGALILLGMASVAGASRVRMRTAR